MLGWPGGGSKRARAEIRVSGSDIAVNESGELRLGESADLGGFDRAVLEEHEGGDAADAVLGGVDWFSSMFSFATLRRPEYSEAIWSSAGAIILQGPHHSAQ